jgi:hypothetical protein
LNLLLVMLLDLPEVIQVVAKALVQVVIAAIVFTSTEPMLLQLWRMLRQTTTLLLRSNLKT